MPPYRRPSEVNWTPTKYDKCIVKLSGHPYRHQAGSGRAEALKLAIDGETIESLTKRCAEQGFDSGFVVGSLLKQMGAKDHAFDVVAPDGMTLEQIKSQRQERAVSPEAQAAREAKAAAAEAKKAERAAAAEAKLAEKEAAKQAKAEAAAAAKAAKEAAAAEAKAAKEAAAAEAKAKAAKEAAPNPGEGGDAQPPAATKGKGKGKSKPTVEGAAAA